MIEINSSRVNLMVANIEKAVDFYVNELGLTLLNQFGNHYAEIKAPDLLIGLHVKNSNTTVGNNMSIGFGVKKFDLHVNQLKSKGIAAEIEADGWIRLAYFRDLDNNVLFLAENKD